MSLMEIASLAQVSTATVSKVINGYSSVSEEMVAKVQAAMQELDYSPVRRKRRGKMEHLPVAVLVLHANEFHPYTSTFFFMVAGVEAALSSRGIDMVLAHVTRAEEIPQLVASRQVRGLLLIGHEPDESVLALIHDLPAVWLTSHHACAGNVLLAGNEAVGRLAADYLCDRGHRRVAALTAMRNPVVDLRCQFFEFVAAGRGSSVARYYAEPVDAVTRGPDRLDLAALEASLAPHVDRFLADGERPTGMFVPFDMQVAMVYRLLAKRGIQPGRDLEIIGSDDEKAALIGLYPRPATINIGPTTIGRRAVEQLFWRIEHVEEDDRRVRVMVEPELVPGDS